MHVRVCNCSHSSIENANLYSFQRMFSYEREKKLVEWRGCVIFSIIVVCLRVYEYMKQPREREKEKRERENNGNSVQHGRERPRARRRREAKRGA